MSPRRNGLRFCSSAVNDGLALRHRSSSPQILDLRGHLKKRYSFKVSFCKPFGPYHTSLMCDACLVKAYCAPDQRSGAYTPRVGLEPTTPRLTAACSTIELSRNGRFRRKRSCEAGFADAKRLQTVCKAMFHILPRQAGQCP